jgi:hypothetical protein
MSALGHKLPRPSLPPKADIHRTGQLVAFLHCRRPALVDVGGKIDKVNAALRFLARLDSHDRESDIAAERPRPSFSERPTVAGSTADCVQF